MKYIGIFENYNNIEDICQYYYINNYTINKDGSIDVDQDVILSNLNLSKLPLRFNSINGFFDCGNNYLTSLEGCPRFVGRFFNCDFNKLISLEGCPEYVNNNFNCSYNKLISLKGCTEYINNSFNCEQNQLITLKYFPEVNYDIYIKCNPLPMEIYENEDYIKDIVKLQYDYGIWNYNDGLNVSRFDLMMEEIKKEL